MSTSTDNQDTKPCIDCAQPIPVKAHRCIHDNCGAYQDWRRYFGGNANVLTIATLLAVLLSITLNVFQIRDLSNKASKEDVAEIGRSLDERLGAVNKERAELQRQLLAVPEEYKNRYRRFLESPDSGITKLIPEAKYGEVLPQIRGGGYYSFLDRTHDWGARTHDIGLIAGPGDGFLFETGFSGANYGFFLRLGDIPIQDVGTATESPPSFLTSETHDAWRTLWNYRPPETIQDVRAEQVRFNTGVRYGSAVLRDQIAAEPSTTYLVRSLSIDEADLLIAIRTEGQLDDQSFVLVWRVLKVFDTPRPIGKEP